LQELYFLRWSGQLLHKVMGEGRSVSPDALRVQLLASPSAVGQILHL